MLLLRQRLPFFGLFLAASAGIMCAAFTSWNSLIFIAGFMAAFIAWWFYRGVWLFIAIGAAFGAMHLWQNKESSAVMLANAIAHQRVLVSVEGVVSSEPTSSGGERVRFTMSAKNISLSGRSYHINTEILVLMEGKPPQSGDTICVKGSLTTIAPPRNPGQFNAKTWLERQGITCQIDVATPSDLILLSEGSEFSLSRVAQHCRGWMVEKLRLGIQNDPVVCDLLLGMILGITASIPETLQEQFRGTGTFHLFSVSGLHVGMIGILLWQAFKMVNANRPMAVILIIPALFFYALITGWKPSSVRAAFMSAIFLIGMTAWRQPIPFNSLCAAGFLILIESTNELFNPGFQFSFIVVAAILLVAFPLQQQIQQHCCPDPFLPRLLWTRWQKWRTSIVLSIGTLATVSLAAWLGSLPLTIAYFHMVSLSALIANLLIVPLAFVIMATAAVSLVSSLFSGVFFTIIFNNANWAFTKLLLAIVQATAMLPCSFFYVALPEQSPTTLTIFDFGAGGATAIESEDRMWLIDCGSLWNVNTVILPWLQSRGKMSSNGLLLTHGDARHIGGALELIQRHSPDIIVESPLNDRSSQRGKLHRALETLGIPKSIHRTNDQIIISSCASIKILHPPSGISGNEADDKILVCRLDTSGSRILFLSDASHRVQHWLVENLPGELAANILVQGRPRTAVPIEAAFLDAVRPELVISTASTFPENEPLDENWATALEVRGIKLFRQDETGAVRIEIFKDGYRAIPYLKPFSSISHVK